MFSIKDAMLFKIVYLKFEPRIEYCEILNVKSILVIGTDSLLWFAGYLSETLCERMINSGRHQKYNINLLILSKKLIYICTVREYF